VSGFFKTTRLSGNAGAFNPTGTADSRAAISASRYCFSNNAAAYSRTRIGSVRTLRSIARCRAEHFPCVVRAEVIRAIPSAVRGPVLRPPCLMHRTFAIAGAWQAQPEVRAHAPQRGARFNAGLPSGLPRRQWLASPPGPPGRRPVGGAASPGVDLRRDGTRRLPHDQDVHRACVAFAGISVETSCIHRVIRARRQAVVARAAARVARRAWPPAGRGGGDTAPSTHG
jgi:hypothetical protein